MPQLSEITYSREATITAIRDYYRYLTKMYLPESAVIEPPVGGWPNITTDTMRSLGKTDQVGELLRHLPYIRAGNPEVLGAAYTHFADWRWTCERLARQQDNPGDVRLITEGLEYENVPPHVVGLTDGCRDNCVFLLDTHLGIIHWSQGCPSSLSLNHSPECISDEPEDYAPDHEQEWRTEGPAWSIVDFFELLKGEFQELKFIPSDSTMVYDVYTTYPPRDGEIIPILQRIYRESGWPISSNYDKESCLAKVQKAIEEHCQKP